MKISEIKALIAHGNFPEKCPEPELIETHISWVILCNKYAYKIKKPVNYGFLDFSTLEKRNYYCKQEVLLNRRLVDNIYLGVVPVINNNGKFEILKDLKEEAIDYAVMMHKMDNDKRMDNMLKRGEVSERHMESIAEVLVKFHKKAPVIYKTDPFNVQHNFNDILKEKSFLSKELGAVASGQIDNALIVSGEFIQSHEILFKKRAEFGFIRDVHGDLHSRNIFLYNEPLIFDCIEFNDDIRQIDILSELAFFCMDLEAFGYSNLSEYFIRYYNQIFQVMNLATEKMLFIYYKAYRANVRAKVNALRAKEASGKNRKLILLECSKYLSLMSNYIKILKLSSVI